MKKTAAILIALTMLLGAGALAFTGSGYPSWDGASAPGNSLCGSIGGQKLKLEFDPSSEYSSMADGMIEACFFAFDSAEQNYLEMYLLLPEDAAAGDVFSSAGDGMSAIYLYEVYPDDSYSHYYAAQAAGFAFPSGSGYELKLDAAEKTASAVSMRGSLSGKIARFDGETPTGETLELSGVQFDFTLPLSASAAPQPSAAPSVQPSAAPQPPAPTTQPSAMPFPSAAPTAAPKKIQPTLDPHPDFTLPPDYAII